MILTLKRISSDNDATIGALFINDDVSTDLECFTVEDQHQTEKIYGETRIPAGVYPITLRKGSGMAGRYDAKYSHIGHDGMLWINNVPNFEFIYIHVGNTDDDTEGCILVNDSIHVGHRGQSSVKAYTRLYPKLKSAIEQGPVYIEVIDE